MKHVVLTTLVLAAILRATARIVDPVQAAEDALISATRFNPLGGLDVSSRNRCLHLERY